MVFSLSPLSLPSPLCHLSCFPFLFYFVLVPNLLELTKTMSNRKEFPLVILAGTFCKQWQRQEEHDWHLFLKVRNVRSVSRNFAKNCNNANNCNNNWRSSKMLSCCKRTAPLLCNNSNNNNCNNSLSCCQFFMMMWQHWMTYVNFRSPNLSSLLSLPLSLFSRSHFLSHVVDVGSCWSCYSRCEDWRQRRSAQKANNTRI